MRNLALVFGLTALVGMSAFACGDDVTNSTTSGGSGGSGGDGGATVTTNGGGGTGGTTTTTACDGPFDHVCEEACCKVEVECGFAGSCALAGSLLMVDLTTCAADEAQCVGQCLKDANCLAIASLAGMTPDQDLVNCLAPCTGPCLGCVFEGCGTDINTCTADANCQAFIQCAAACPDMDGACLTQCATDNPSQATSDLLACGSATCSTECGLGSGGAGGGGGAGGAGGGN